MMRLTIVGVMMAVVATGAQEASAPALSAEEQIMVSAVMALQATATKACEALPEVKSYTDVLAQAQAALKASGKAVDWRTGAVAKSSVQ